MLCISRQVGQCSVLSSLEVAVVRSGCPLCLRACFPLRSHPHWQGRYQWSRTSRSQPRKVREHRPNLRHHTSGTVHVCMSVSWCRGLEGWEPNPYSPSSEANSRPCSSRTSPMIRFIPFSERRLSAYGIERLCVVWDDQLHFWIIDTREWGRTYHVQGRPSPSQCR